MERNAAITVSLAIATLFAVVPCAQAGTNPPEPRGGGGLPGLSLLTPANGATVSAVGQRFTWVPDPQAFYYRLTLLSTGVVGYTLDLDLSLGGVANEAGGPITCAGQVCSINFDPASLPSGRYRWTIEGVTVPGETLPGIQEFTYERAAAPVGPLTPSVEAMATVATPQTEAAGHALPASWQDLDVPAGGSRKGGGQTGLSLLAPANLALVSAPGQRFSWVPLPLFYYRVSLFRGADPTGFSLDATLRIGGLPNQAGGPIACVGTTCTVAFDPFSMPNGSYRWTAGGVTVAGETIPGIEEFNYRRAPNVIFGNGFEVGVASPAVSTSTD